MAKVGFPSCFITIIRHIYESMMAGFRDSSHDFPISNGVKQGCVLAPTLFNMMFSAMLTDAFNLDDPGVISRYRKDGKLLNLRCLNAAIKVNTIIIRDLLFADDCVLNINPEYNMQHNIDQ